MLRGKDRSRRAAGAISRIEAGHIEYLTTSILRTRRDAFQGWIT
jgi:hypothetical protein